MIVFEFCVQFRRGPYRGRRQSDPQMTREIAKVTGVRRCPAPLTNRSETIQ
jgi:hypothetical protein